MRKLKIERIFILILIPILILGIGIFLFKDNDDKEERTVQSNYYDLDKFEYVDGLMSFKDSNYTTLTGIDVSSFNGDIDWASVKNDGIDFVMIRCGFRGGEDGILYDDPMYTTYIEEAKQAGLKVGVYFYSSAITTNELDEEVEYVLDIVKDYKLDLPIAYDMEYYNDAGRITSLSRKEKTNMALRFCKKIEAKGYDPMIYGNLSWLYNDVNFKRVSNYPLWIAAYTSSCPMEDEFKMWQYSNQATINGIDGVVDINIWIDEK